MTDYDLPELVERVPLHSEQAEMAVLGSCLLKEKVAAEVCAILSPEDFYRPAHQVIFRAIAALVSRGAPVEEQALEEELKDSGGLRAAGGPDYLLDVVSYVVSAANGAHYADIVREKAARREAIRIGNEIIDAAQHGHPLEAISETGAGMAARLSSANVRSVSRDWKELCHTVPYLTRPRGVPSGNPSLDRILSTKGLAIGQVTMVTAETGGGKTTWMLGSTFQALERGERCAFLSFADLDAEEIQRRACRWMCGREDFRDCHDLEEEAKLKDALEAIHKWDFEIFDAESSDGANDFETAKAWLLRVHAEKPLTRASWDYAQEIETSAPGMAKHDRFHRQAYIAKRCRILAGQLKVPFIIGAQLSGKGDDEAIAESKFWEKVASLIIRVNDSGLTIKKSRFGGVKTTVAHRYVPSRWTHVAEALL